MFPNCVCFVDLGVWPGMESEGNGEVKKCLCRSRFAVDHFSTGNTDENENNFSVFSSHPDSLFCDKCQTREKSIIDTTTMRKNKDLPAMLPPARPKTPK